MTDMSQATDNTSASTAKMNGINGSHYLTHDNPDRIQIIDDQKKFTPELTEQIRRWNLGDVGFDYDIVAVFGSQSTGKSTLLNRLFGTNFDVMDESKRQQTTKGIWMCRGADMNVMVMDVEGTDGRERGEDQDFERKSALFSLASSEVLIVNLWEHQVGLYQGANMGLLKTVFEVNLGLFGKSQNGTNQRTLLLFVIRDHIGTTPLENLCATLTADMNKIWESLSKPDELQDRKLSDYFDLSFTALPHKILAADKFEHDVQQLRRRFTDKEREDYVFKSSYHKRIPADGVALYMEGIWEQVQSNKDLDLPTQQELLAQFRCDEISAAALIEFNEQAKSQRRPVETGRVVDNLGQMMRAWRSRTLEQYDRNASRYHQGVYNRKRADLIAVIDSTLSPLYLGQLKNLHKFCLNAFKKQMLENMRTEGYNFAEVVADARARCEKTFTEAAKEARLEDTEWTWEDEFDLLMEDVKSVADQCRADETKKMVNSIERNLRRQISEPVELHLDRARSDMWDKVLSVFKETLQKAESAYMSKAKSFGCTQDENVSALATLRKRAWVALRAKITEQTADSILLSKLKSYFEERFRYDEKGIPRVWKPDDDIDGAFKKARDETVQLIPLYSKIEPTDPSTTYELPADSISISLEDSQSTEDYDFPASLVIFSENKVAELSARFRKDVDAYYIEAKRSMVSSIAQIPPWMYGALLVLGWNEAMAVLFNPLYFTMLLIGLSLAFGIIKLGLAGPLMQITRTLTNEIQRQATNKLREQFSNPELTEPVHTKPLEEAFEQLEMEDRNNSTESKRDIEPL